MSEEEDIQADLENTIKEVGWNDLAPWCEKGVVYLVDPDLNLAQVGAEMVTDATKRIENYIDDGLLFPPNKKEVDLWSKHRHMRFFSVKVHPFILVRPK